MDVEYEHECSRAELLGLAKPTREEFLNSRMQAQMAQEDEYCDNEEAEQLKAENVNENKETMGRMAGGLEELNSILSNTQKKLNKFKTVFGNFSNLLKFPSGTKGESDEREQEDEGESSKTNQANGYGLKQQEEEKSGKVNSAAGSGLDKLDSLIMKAEKAELSLSSQNKQMKKFLN